MKTIFKKIKDKFFVDNSYGQKEINKQLIIICCSVIATVLCTVGVSLSAFVWSDTSVKEQQLIVGDLKLVINSTSEDSPETLGENLHYPMETEDALKLAPYEFTLTNEGDYDATYSLKIADDDDAIAADDCAANQIYKGYIGILVEGSNDDPIIGPIYNNYKPLSLYEDKAIDTGILEPQESKKYKIYLWIGYNAPNNMIGKHYHGKIVLESTQTVDVIKNLSDTILEDNKDMIQTKEPTFFDLYSQDDGLFKVINKDIYYFRGSVNINNYLIFGNYKTDITNSLTTPRTFVEGFRDEVVASAGNPIVWRIMRINKEENSVTLISENSIGVNEKFSNDPTTNYEGSTIKAEIDKWYTDTFGNTKYDNLVLNTDFCNEHVSADDLKNIPSLGTCNGTTVNSKAGLITLSEVRLANGDVEMYSEPIYYTYLQDAGINFWTMSSDQTKNAFYYYKHQDWLNWDMVSGPQTQATDDSSLVASVRPVITIKGDAIIKSGDGTKRNPYLLRINEDTN